MRGLIEKDMCLLLKRSKVFVVLIGVAIIMGSSTDGSFAIGFLTMLCAILTVGTISYDEFDNGYPFLFTLPVTTKTYVNGKYIFCMLGGLIGWVVSIVIFSICSLVSGSGFTVLDILENAVFIPVVFFIMALMLPIQLKFGAERSRIAIFVIGGGMWAIFTLLLNNLPEDFQIPAWISELSDNTMTILMIIFCIVALCVSYVISLHIMEKKEF